MDGYWRALAAGGWVGMDSAWLKVQRHGSRQARVPVGLTGITPCGSGAQRSAEAMRHRRIHCAWQTGARQVLTLPATLAVHECNWRVRIAAGQFGRR